MSREHALVRVVRWRALLPRRSVAPPLEILPSPARGEPLAWLLEARDPPGWSPTWRAGLTFGSEAWNVPEGVNEADLLDARVPAACSSWAID